MVTKCRSGKKSLHAPKLTPALISSCVNRGRINSGLKTKGLLASWLNITASGFVQDTRARKSQTISRRQRNEQPTPPLWGFVRCLGKKDVTYPLQNSQETKNKPNEE